MKVIKHYKSCKLNSKHSKLETLSLSSVWKFINGKILDGAHNSLVDAKAQTDVVIHPYFIGYLNKTYSIQSVNDIFQKKTQNRVHQLEEQARLVHTPWMSDENAATWSISWKESYQGPEGGPPYGPSTEVTSIATNIKSTLADIFLFVMPLSIFEMIKKCHKSMHMMTGWCHTRVKIEMVIIRKGNILCHVINLMLEQHIGLQKSEINVILQLVIFWHGLVLFYTMV